MSSVLLLLIPIQYHRAYFSLPSFLIYLFFNIYLFGCAGSQLWHARYLLRHVGSLVAACELLVAARGIQFSDQGSNLRPPAESQPLDHQGSPLLCLFLTFLSVSIYSIFSYLFNHNMHIKLWYCSLKMQNFGLPWWRSG